MKKTWKLSLILPILASILLFQQDFSQVQAQTAEPAAGTSLSTGNDRLAEALAQSCPQAVDGLPPASDTVGSLLLMKGSDTAQFFTDSLLDLRRGLFLTSPISSSNVRWEPDNVAFSPNKLWAAFIAYTLDAPGIRQASRKLHVRNALGYALDLSYWQVDWQYIIGWVNNQEIALSTPGRALGEVTVLNPFTGKFRVVKTVPSGMKLSGNDSNTQNYYNDDLSSAILPVDTCDCDGKDSSTWMEFDESGRATTWIGDSKMNNRPAWSPDAHSVALIGNVAETPENGLTGQIYWTDPAGYGNAITGTLRFPGYDLSHLMTWSPDSRYIAFWYMPDTEGSVWTAEKHLAVVDTQRWDLVDTCVSSQTILGDLAPVWSPDQQYIAVASNDDYSTDTKIVDLVNGKAYTIGDAIPYGWMSSPGSAPTALADLSQETSLLTSSDPNPPTTVEQDLGGRFQVPKTTQAIDLDHLQGITNLAQWTVEGGEMISSLAFSGDDRYLAAGYQNGMVSTIDRQSGVVDRRMIGGGEYGVCSLQFVPGTDELVAGLYDGRVMKLRTDRAMPAWEARLPVGICDISVSADGETVLAAQKIGGQNAVFFLSVSDGSIITTVDGFSAGFVPGKNRFVLSTSSKDLALWQLDPLQMIMALGQVDDERTAIEVSPDGSLALAVPTSIGSAERVRIFRVSDGTSLNPLSYTRNTNMVAFSPDSQIIVTGVSGDNSVYLWNASSGDQLTHLPGHSLPVTAVAFSPDAKWLASGSDDSKIIIWGIR